MKRTILMIVIMLIIAMPVACKSEAGVLAEAVQQVQAQPHTMLVNKAKALLMYRLQLESETARVNGLLEKLDGNIDVTPAIPECGAPFEAPDYMDSWR
jgi:hypothetical protein